MKIKRFLPLIILILFSCILVAGITGYFLADSFASKYPEDVSIKISLSLKQGLGLSAIVILIVWIGAGIDFGLSRIKDGARRKAASLTVYLVSFFLCIVLPLAGLLLVYGIFSMEDGWQKLPAPPERPSAVVAGGPNSLIIETEEGNYFYCWMLEESTCWQPENKPSDLVIGGADYRTEVSTHAPEVNPPGKVVSMVGIAYSNGPEKSESHYAVLDDGTVWYLSREVNNSTANFITGFLSMMVLPILLAAIVFFAGAGINSLFRRLVNRIPEPASPKVSDESAN